MGKRAERYRTQSCLGKRTNLAHGHSEDVGCKSTGTGVAFPVGGSRAVEGDKEGRKQRA